MTRLLILGGTIEARLLATALHPEHEVTTSLAGRVRAPVPPPGRIRIGGFGGVDGLTGYLRDARIDALVDATHPFAAAMTTHAAAAAAVAGVPLLVLRRPGFTAVDGDRWVVVDSLPAAAAALPELGQRVFLTTGRTGLAAFAGSPLWFLVRSVDPPRPPVPARMRVLLDRGPFTLDGERALLREHRIDVLVTKDSGGSMTQAKLVAAREAGIPVVVQRRPPLPDGLTTVATVDEAVGWVRALPVGLA